MLITEGVAALIAVGPAKLGVAPITKHAFAIFYIAAIVAKCITRHNSHTTAVAVVQPQCIDCKMCDELELVTISLML